MSEPEIATPEVGASDTVALTVPADSAYVSVLRTVTASLAARRDFTIEEIDDLRIAVDEASALLLPHAGPGAQLNAAFTGGADSLQVEVSLSPGPDEDVPTEDGAIDETSFAWMVLAALADEVRTDRSSEALSLTLVKARGARG
ncbi:ATP-binding protein [Jatrophihabitans telluris]|uniref:ATP-binding protein n=1 Tax=Jatrophihabitans telluris TaxID=2038343 RepID=A0ABY4R1M9_9ACTN|nr:ATP-binding protein [Jatrophihabitans telluris]UQX89816.1 ATP-binding protein [Jatrophihabitans telluris]